MADQILMTPEEFELAKHKLKTLRGTVIDLAEQIIVQGKTKSEAAKAVGVSRQNVQKHMNRVNALLNDLPADYVWFEAWMPEKLASEIRQRLKSDET